MFIYTYILFTIYTYNLSFYYHFIKLKYQFSESKIDDAKGTIMKYFSEKVSYETVILDSNLVYMIIAHCFTRIVFL